MTDCASAFFDTTGLWDVSLFDYECPAVTTTANVPKSITVSVGERITSTVSVAERVASTVSITE